ncbi:MAG: cytochrome c [Candidatus Pseudobacter hemicellulosilyticus]|uniref:Cytochrome c n=1 Tax=Candidatus Pseudobacter hemicellulosilyticus TaxID=3121375 RepID=A0AAJ6BEX6_9BACT|nr:MAG: cytochrome c [Pseudobacter sp.]
MKWKVWLTLVILFFLYSSFVYVYSASEKAPELPSAEVKAGWKVWQQKNCHTCHQLYGLGGYMGPDLTNIASDKNKGNPLYLKAFIMNGTPSMPNLHLTDDEIDKVIAFLKWVDKSGKSQVPDSAVHWTGTYVF